MRTFETLIKGHIITAYGEIPNGYIAIDNGKVAHIGDISGGVPSAKEVEDFTGCYVMPAAIDAQTHSRSQAGQEDFIWSTRAAAAGGVATLVDMPYDAGRLICNKERFELKKSEALAQTRVDFALYGTVHPEEGIRHIAEQVEAGAIGFKFSAFGTDPERFPRIPPYLMYDCFTEIAKYGLVAGVHNEDDETVKYLIEKVKSEGITDYRAHTLSRPIYSENLAVSQVYEIGAMTNCRAHIVHCSNGRGYEICNSYRQQGFNSTIEACLHYLVLSEEEDVSRLVGRAKVNPPIRGKAEREAIWKHLAAGNVTVVSTDHVSWSLDKKMHENMFANSSGAASLEVLVTLLVDGAIKRGVPLSRLAQVLAYNPARLFSLQGQKGALEIGCDADITIVKRDPYIYKSSDSGHNFTDWSAYDGRTIDYRIAATMVAGRWVFDGKNVLAEPGSGRFVRPSTLSKNA
ncbi:amidohydrolase family protein [Pasteurella skyensis]|uniref:Amidohydrolase family protein n=1 Tax=Phocoenobacter skyensis TaxID=97481 RepID=A0AAJ6N953_9PAST|nr:amidohydrolase family protein [Pasteurella skyensis]MDP8162500.1 amidohydrolase family protein [Pasteurella skyensis]MDP8172465.1 amidohydrolase family protein [Pasteurella skyensis]MDP8177490.1 amidohydrolase family protein [Pasteurella skyensis]MDP8178720.1 amidohydrolase family protein [Pasteurella skyensis]MDP8182990.1 amidohydrolase family protein [Pasteurella skyensis]